MLYRSLENLSLSNSWVTVGSYDGVHIGHQSIIGSMVNASHAEGSQAVVVTFHPHPSVILKGVSGRFYLSDPEERADLMMNLGVDHVVILPFSKSMAQQSAQDFCASLVSHLGMRHLWVGTDFKMGNLREGDVHFLHKTGSILGFEVHAQPRIVKNGKAVSSSLIRHHLTQGDVRKVTSLLLRPYQVSGVVIHGYGRGKTIGFPTANLQVWSERLLPANGVYATQVWMKNQMFQSVTNIGYRPTFKQPIQLSVETHILDFDQDIYDQILKVDFIQYLRPEQQFSSTSDLIDQLHQDVHETRKVLVDAR